MVQRVTVSPHLLEPCPEPRAEGATNGALLGLIQALRGSLRSCNADKAAIKIELQGD